MDCLKIRQFKSEDAEELSKIIRRNFLEVNIKDYDAEKMYQLANIYNYEKVLAIASYAHMYVACLNDTIVGCGAISSYWGKEDESIYRLEKFR